LGVASGLHAGCPALLYEIAGVLLSSAEHSSVTLLFRRRHNSVYRYLPFHVDASEGTFNFNRLHPDRLSSPDATQGLISNI